MPPIAAATAEVAAPPKNSRSPTAPKVRVRKASELIAHELRHAIIRGEIKEGTMLPEYELLEQFGVSRPTLREAIRMLESEHLLELSRGPKGGAKVLKPSLDVAARYVGFLMQIEGVSLADLYRASALIEPVAVRLIARENPVKAAAALRACLADTKIAPGQMVENARTFSRFHQVLVEQTGVKTLILVMSLLNNLFQRYLVGVAAEFGKDVRMQMKTDKLLKLMNQVADLVEQGDGEGAAALWAEFLEDAEARLRSWEPSLNAVDILGAEQFEPTRAPGTSYGNLGRGG